METERGRCVVVGAGGMGREAATWAIDAGWEVVGFADDRASALGERVAGFPVLGIPDDVDEPGARLVLAIGNPRDRQSLANRAAAHGRLLATLIHPTAFVGTQVVGFEGAIVGPQVTISTGVTLGRCVIVNYGAVIGHDVRLGDFAFVGPNAAIAGNVQVAEGVEVGIGATVVQGHRVGAWARIGAGAAVVDDVPSGETVVGVPAQRKGPSGQAGRPTAP